MLTANRFSHKISNLRQWRIVVSLALAGVCYRASPASAIDCAEAKTPVEVAICSSDRLKVWDELLSKRYFEAMKSAKENGFFKDGKSLYDLILARQREWLTQREKDCGVMQGDKINSCIHKFINDRKTELNHQSFDALMLGTEKLMLGEREDDGAIQLLHNGIAVIEDLYSKERPFTVTDRWRSKETTAVLIGITPQGTDQDAEIYVVETRKPGEVTAHKLGDSFLGASAPRLKRDQRGFHLITPAFPTRAGETVDWIAETGEVSKSASQFRPASGTTMVDLMRRDIPEFEQPLNYADFYAAVDRLPAADRVRVMKALWQELCDGCRNPFNINMALYGVRMREEAVSYSGCGLTMIGSRMYYEKDDALAVWDRKVGAFYFAVAPHTEDGRHTEADTVHFYPPVGDWSAPALAELELWKNGAKWREIYD